MLAALSPQLVTCRGPWFWYVEGVGKISICSRVACGKEAGMISGFFVVLERLGAVPHLLSSLAVCSSDGHWSARTAFLRPAAEARVSLITVKPGSFGLKRVEGRPFDHFFRVRR